MLQSNGSAERSVEISCDTNVALVAFFEHFREQAFTVFGRIGNADFGGIVGKTAVTAGKEVNVGYVAVLQRLGKGSSIKLFAKIFDTGIGVKIKVKGTFHLSHKGDLLNGFWGLSIPHKCNILDFFVN